VADQPRKDGLPCMGKKEGEEKLALSLVTTWLTLIDEFG